MESIFRYPLEIADHQTVLMPAGALPLSVAPSRTHPDALDVWALVDTNASSSSITISIFGTGKLIDGRLGVFLGTCQTHDGQFVWHVFWGRG